MTKIYYVEINDNPQDQFIDEEELRMYGVDCDVLFYWYEYYSYSGGGRLLMRDNNKWYLHDMGHCSCYGPLSDANKAPFIADKLSEIKDKCSEEEWTSYVKLLVDCAKKVGYK